MNRDQFTKFAQNYAARHPDVVRLDDLNPFAAMDYLKQRFNSAARSLPPTIDEWAARMDMDKYRSAAIPTTGVRQTLTALFTHMRDNGYEFWLPEDVYPFYWQVAHDAQITPQSFTTLPAPAFAPLRKAGPRAVMLLTNPVTPLGCVMNDVEIGTLKSWLAASSQRRIILDTVYTYDRKFDKGTKNLLATGQCYIAHSLSKSWLERGVFGILVPPPQDAAAIRAALPAPQAEAYHSAYAALTRQSALPDIQQAAFTRAWARMTPEIRKFDPDFKPPLTGYFALVNAPWDTVLKQHNTLLLPASVFGSKNLNLSIASCLHGINSAHP